MARKPRSKIVDRHFEDSSSYNKPEPQNTQAPSNRLKIRIEDLKTIKPMTDNQKMFFDSYAEGEEFIMLSGSAGTGKSYIAIYKALEEILDKSNPYNRVLIVRSAVQTREVGFTKGSLEEKGAIYEAPYEQICSNLFNKKEAYSRLKEQGYVEFTTTTCLRGQTFDNTIVIADECENFTFAEFSTIITRTGRDSKIIFAGDTKQNDLTKKSNDVSGMRDFIKVADSMKEFCHINFTSADIVRSGLVKSFIIACEKLGL
jgi:phosphate starvation-inducible protein PhoH